MDESVTEMAKRLGVSKSTASRRRKIASKTGADPEAEIRELKDVNTVNVKRLDELRKGNKSFKPNVRRIDRSDVSSLHDMLQDAKERYVANEELIQKLQYEIDQVDVLMTANTNGTVSVVPQLASMERFQKLNISLRNQILALETEIGRIAQEKDDDPFE